jgi:hypothetical protein
MGPIFSPSICILEKRSANTIMSYIRGTAKRESSQTL